MDTRSTRPIEDLFHEALELPPPERAALLARLRSDQPELASELDSLLSAHAVDPAFLEAPAPRPSRAAEDPPLQSILRQSHVLARGEGHPETVFGELFNSLRTHTGCFGRYRFREEVGRGGMGVVRRVWDGEFERDVAMKQLGARGGPELGATPPADTRSLGLFFKEAKVTGFLDHPGIVPVHELGLDDHGGVYFTMRLVRGRELGEIFDHARANQEGWSLPRAIGVLIKVCDAMAYAHSKGVVHRDLKPANIMVGRFGEVYVMDWGIAAVLGCEDVHDLRIREDAATGAEDSGNSPRTGATPDVSLMTEDGLLVGTPVYMSPEQARGETRRLGPCTDIYALGAILYRLLTGEPPYVARGKHLAPQAILHQVRKGSPRPVHEQDAGAPPELEAICEKAMAREPEQRYASMQELSRDLQDWLDGRVVRAYETGAVAELKKWMKRNKSLAASLLAAVFFATGGLGSTAYVQAQARTQQEQANETLSRTNADLAQANSDLGRSRSEALENAERATEEADEARRQRAAADRVVEFMVNLFNSPDPELARGQEVTAKEVLQRGVNEIQSGLELEPLVRARLMHAMGKAFQALGVYPSAEPLFEEALAIRMRELGELDPDTLTSLLAKAMLHLDAGRIDEAEPLYEEVLAGRREIRGELHEETITALIGMAEVHRVHGRFDQAEAQFSKALEDARHVAELDPTYELVIKSRLAMVLESQGRLEDARVLNEEVLAARRARHGSDHPNTLYSLNNLAALLQKQGLYLEALPLCQEALERGRRVFGENHPTVLVTLNNLGAIYLDLRRYSEARETFERCLEAKRRVLPQDHPETLNVMGNLAYCYERLALYDEAAKLGEEALAAVRRKLGLDHPDTLVALANLASTYESQGRYEEAEPLYEEALEGMERRLGEDHPHTMSAVNNLGFLYMSMERWEDAAPLMERAWKGLRQGVGEEHPRTLTTLHSLISVYVELGRFEEAEPLARDLLERTPENDRMRRDREVLLERIESERR